MRFFSRGDGNGSSNGGSGASAINAPDGPETVRDPDLQTVPERVPEPPSGLDEPPMKE